MDEKLKKIIFIVLGCFVLLFLILFLLTSCGKKLSPMEFENEIVSNSKKYFSVNKEELPKSDSTITFSLNNLISKGIIDELDKILDSDVNCSGNLVIENNNGYYMYSPKLSCTNNGENYNTDNLKDALLEKVVTSGNGLYNVGTEYFFKGDNVDNYIIFDGIKWRITKINADGSIRLIEDNKRTSVVWDNRYNSEKLSNTGLNNFVYDGLNSRMKDYLDNIYENEEILSDDGKGFIKKTTLCIGKRSLQEIDKTGAIECSETLENQYLGLLQVNEYLIASLDPNCQNTISFVCGNYNYLANFANSYWSITSSSENNHKVYKFSNSVSDTTASNTAMARLVINISENTNISGTGTLDDPYVVNGFNTELKSFN